MKDNNQPLSFLHTIAETESLYTKAMNAKASCNFELAKNSLMLAQANLIYLATNLAEKKLLDEITELLQEVRFQLKEIRIIAPHFENKL